MSLFRERLLARLVECRAISRQLVAKLLAWRHPGFSAHVGEEVAPEEKQRLEDTAAYLVRNPLSLKKLVYLDGERAVVYRSRMNPFLGRSFEAMDPLEWLARLSDHIPDPGQHSTLSWGRLIAKVYQVDPLGLHPLWQAHEPHRLRHRPKGMAPPRGSRGAARQPPERPFDGVQEEVLERCCHPVLLPGTRPL
jgi:hypothetical protein